MVTDTWPASSACEFRRKVRTLAGNFQLIAAAPWLLTPANRVLFQLVSHKLLRLLVPYFLLSLLSSAAILGLHSPAYLAFAVLQLGFWLLAAASLKVTVPVLHRLTAARRRAPGSERRRNCRLFRVSVYSRPTVEDMVAHRVADVSGTSVTVMAP